MVFECLLYVVVCKVDLTQRIDRQVTARHLLDGDIARSAGLLRQDKSTFMLTLGCYVTAQLYEVGDVVACRQRH